MRDGKLKQKMQLVYEDKYGPGITNPSQLEIVKQKKAQTAMAHYGVDNPSRSAVIKQKKVDTCLKNHGVINPYCRPDNVQKRRDVCMERYGVPTPLQCPDVLARSNGPEGIARRFETMRKNGNVWKSGPEDHVARLFVDAFGAGAVERHVNVNGWSIDFYVVPLDRYVQFDGTFWHGKTFDDDDELKERYPVIYRKKVRDREQNVWFPAAGKRLVRVDELEFKEHVKTHGADVSAFLRFIDDSETHVPSDTPIRSACDSVARRAPNR